MLGRIQLKNNQVANSDITIFLISISVVIFIDEIDAIGRIRTCKEEETTRRLKSELLCQIDGITTGNGIGDEPFIFGCTNCPWDLDPAVLRRFSRRIFVDLPNSQGMVQLILDSRFWFPLK